MKCVDRYMIRDADSFKKKWDFLIIVLANWCSFSTPYSIAFHFNFLHSTFSLSLHYFLNFFFLFDILFNFRTTFIHSRTNEEISNPKIIAKIYLKRRFWIDLLVAIPFYPISRTVKHFLFIFYS